MAADYARTRLELDRRRCANRGALVAEVEEIFRRETESGSEQSGGKALDAGIVFLDRIVEETPRGRDLVLEIRQLGLQLLEIRTGFEIGIGLGHGKELAERSGEHVFGSRLLCRPLSRHRCIAGFRYLIERAVLM